MAKIKNNVIYILSSYSLYFCVFISLICLYSIYVLLAIYLIGPLHRNDDLKKYEISGFPQKTISENYNNSLLEFKKNTSNKIVTFPNVIVDDNEFFLYNYNLIIEEESLLYGTSYRMEYLSQIYLCCKYDEDSYNKEITRLDSTYYNNKKLTKVKHLFKYPSYIAIYDYDLKYEYTIIDEENLFIYYIFLENISKSNIVFSNNYYPKKKLIFSSISRQEIISKGSYIGGFNIYV